MTRIVKCTVEDILGVRKVEFEPNGNGVVIGGANGEGKSSTMKALIMALGGKAVIPAKPVREGAKVGTVSIELDQVYETETLSIHLEVDPERGTKLKVLDKEGKAIKKGVQTMLDQLTGNSSFDPGGFIFQDKDDRFKTLAKLLGVDPTELEQQYDEKYEARTAIGREVSILQGKIDGRSMHLDVPEDEIEVKSSLEKLKVLHSVNQLTTGLKAKIAIKDGLVVSLTEKGARDTLEIERLLKELNRLNEEVESDKLKVTEYKDEVVKLREELREVEANDNSKVEAEKLDKQLKEFEQTNIKVRENKELIKLQTEWKGVKNQYNGLTAELDEIEMRLNQLIANVKTPIPGLSISRGKVFYEGTPFEQCSESERWQISTAISFALNPKGICFIANSGGLDKKNREVVRARARECGVQLFMEVVDDADDVQILIEEGQVKENRLETAGE